MEVEDKMETRVLAIYSNHDERHIADIILESFDLAKCQSIFKAPGDDPKMYGCYQVGVDQRALIQSYLPNNIELNWANPSISYYLEYQSQGRQG